MKRVRLALKNNPYDIVIGSNILAQLGRALRPLNLGRDAIVITNPIIKKYHGFKIAEGLKKGGFGVKICEVPDGEKSKSAQYAFKLMEDIARDDVHKDIFIVALGGGVVGDLAGFVAAVYKRGIPYIQVPTTFLAQIDSAIGGKVAIDLSVGKNLVGAFCQPKIVYSDVAVLRTLSVRQIRNGLAEAVKYGIIYDQSLFNDLEKNYPQILNGDLSTLARIIFRCSQIKAEVVMADEKETKGIRTILNFGHTVGHAIEAASGYDFYQHGESIALGMRVAGEISCRLTKFKREEADRVNRLLTNIGLPERIEKVSLKKIIELMQHDKKFRSGKNRFVLASSIGRVKVVEGISPDIIKSAILKYMA